MREPRDEMIERVVDALKALPAVPADATARVLARVDAARTGGQRDAETSDDDDVIYFPAATGEMQATPAAAGRPVLVTAPASGSRAAGGLRRRFVVSLPAAIGYALAATMAGFLIRGAVPSDDSVVAIERVQGTPVATEVGTQETSALVPVSSAMSREAQEMPVPVQFVLDARSATRVALVGDFNAWDGSAHPLTRDSASGAWSTVVKVAPGRHVYAFLVDDTVWTLDPRAPRARDADYGAEQSVLIVGVR